MAADLLLNTRWMYVRYEDGRMTADHVEVVRHQGNQVLIVTCYSTPLRSWTVPSAALRIQPSAFFPLGHANDFAWVAVERHVTFVGADNVRPQSNMASFNPNGVGTWVVLQLTRTNVVFAPRPRLIRNTVVVSSHFVGWPRFLSFYRLASGPERARHRADATRFYLAERPSQEPEDEAAPTPPESAPEPEPGPEASRAEAPLRRSRWEHMDDES